MKINFSAPINLKALAMAILALGLITMNGQAQTPPAPPSQTELLQLGERMYREGILPSGAPMQALVSGDVPVSGAAFTCISCHLRSGLGSIEGTVITPPTTGNILYQPRDIYKKGFEMVESVRRYSKALPIRPAYTDESLAAAISGGVDSAGRKMVGAMPLYQLSDQDMAILITYLKSLSAKFSPGVSQEEIRFATVITDGVSPKDVAAMLAPMEYTIARKNSTAGLMKTNPRQSRMAVRMIGPDLAGKRFTLAQWRLHGDPASWPAQLADYYRREPVFALLGGIGSGEWQPVHQFCEELQLPCIFPSTAFPVRSAKDWYTLYFSKGIYQEGEAAARYLNLAGGTGADNGILQVVRDSPKGQALAAGFQDTWRGLGHDAPVTITLPETEPLTGETLRQTLTQKKPATLLLWDDAAGVSTTLTALAAEATRPRQVFVSTSYLASSPNAIPEAAREFTYLAYPYRMPQDDVRYDTMLSPITKGLDLSGAARNHFEQAYSVGEIMSRALADMRGEYYRDFFLDTIGMMGDLDLPLYERLSFGPGQRYAAKGCYIVQLGQGEEPALVKKSEWFIN